MERFLFTKLFMLIVITLVLQIYGCKGCLEKERIALLEIKALIINALTVVVDDPTLESWIDDRVSDCCDWYRVECNTTTGRVINLSLYGLLYHSTPILNFSMFQPFEELQSLNLSRNYFKGWVDSRGAGLANLRNLEVLDLSNNYGLSGTLQGLGNIYYDFTSNLLVSTYWLKLELISPQKSYICKLNYLE
ncbi:hypothetical protein ACOSQ4_032188 [Xanthoceras sorbifolium]